MLGPSLFLFFLFLAVAMFYSVACFTVQTFTCFWWNGIAGHVNATRVHIDVSAQVLGRGACATSQVLIKLLDLQTLVRFDSDGRHCAEHSFKS